jgi:hypothetical protein
MVNSVRIYCVFNKISVEFCLVCSCPIIYEILRLINDNFVSYCVALVKLVSKEIDDSTKKKITIHNSQFTIHNSQTNT